MKKYLSNGHEFSVQEGAVQYLQNGKSHLASFDESLKLVFSWRRQLYLQGKEKIPFYLLPEAARKDFLLDLAKAWNHRNPSAAQKAIFDYADAQKGFSGIALGVSLFLAIPMAVGFLNDSREQFQCTTVLHQGSQVGTMNVVKSKKKRKGHFVLSLEFTAPNGQVIQGTDQWISEVETSIPKSLPMVFSPENPACWSLTPSLDSKEANWAKRRYFGAVGLMLGSFFLLLGLFGAVWSFIRLRQKRPYIQELRSIVRL